MTLADRVVNVSADFTVTAAVVDCGCGSINIFMTLVQFTHITEFL